MWYVYLLECSNKSIYVGCTKDLRDRMLRHNRSEIQATQSRLPAKLVTYITFTDKYKAFDFGKYLKTGSGRAFLNKRLI